MEENTKTVFKFIALIGVLALLVIFLWQPLSYLFKDNNLENLVSEYSTLAPLIFIGLVTAQILIAPVPGQVAAIAGGFLFGALLGTIYGFIGLLLGSWIAFSLSKKLGRPFVELVVPEKHLDKFDYLTEKAGPLTLFAIYLLPFFPDDTICFIAGLTKISIRKFLLVMSVGRLPGFFVLSLLGAGAREGNTLLISIILGAFALLIIGALFYRKEIEGFLKKIS